MFFRKSADNLRLNTFCIFVIYQIPQFIYLINPPWVYPRWVAAPNWYVIINFTFQATKGGILLPESSVGKMTEATVIAVGPGVRGEVRALSTFNYNYSMKPTI